MKKFVIATLAFTLAACTTTAPLGMPPPTGNLAADVKTAVADVTGSAPAAQSETQAIDPLVRAITSPSFVAHANESLVIAGTTDPIFTQCITFALALGQELQARPLLDIPPLAIASADPNCPLCLLAAKRKDLAQLQSGAVAGQIAALRARVRDIETRSAIACAPLLADEKSTFARLGALFP